MYNANKPSADELPSSAQLLRSTVIAILAAAAILVTMVLPAEYGIDPTGVGRLLGLSEMGEIKMQLAKEAEADRHAGAVAATTPDAAPTVVSPVVEAPAPSTTTPAPTAVPKTAAPAAANETAQASAGATADRAAAQQVAPAPVKPAAAWSDEISVTLSPGEGIEIKLVMDAGAKATFEWTANGSVLNYDQHGNGSGQSISYEKGRGVPGQKGVLEAAFKGNHGWFWRNRTKRDVTMTLRTAGDYRDIKR